MTFNILYADKETKARVGKIHTDHGVIETPIFMPVGTLGSVKGVHQRELSEDIKAQIILGNTYHLYLRPGLDVLQQAGGLHKFINWDKPILTDSGGYQVFSLADNRKLTKEGAVFKSHIDGSKHLFTPESVVDIQRTIGADIIMAFDECASPYERPYIEAAMRRTHAWAERCMQAKTRSDQALFGIVQGGDQQLQSLGIFTLGQSSHRPPTGFDRWVRQECLEYGRLFAVRMSQLKCSGIGALLAAAGKLSQAIIE